MSSEITRKEVVASILKERALLTEAIADAAPYQDQKVDRCVIEIKRIDDLILKLSMPAPATKEVP